MPNGTERYNERETMPEETYCNGMTVHVTHNHMCHMGDMEHAMYDGPDAPAGTVCPRVDCAYPLKCKGTHTTYGAMGLNEHENNANNNRHMNTSVKRRPNHVNETVDKADVDKMVESGPILEECVKRYETVDNTHPLEDKEPGTPA